MRLGGRHSEQSQQLYRLCSLVLCYPDDELLAARSEIQAAAAGLRASPASRCLSGFCQWWAGQDPIVLQQHYVEVFDLDKRCGLYLSFYGEGDRRARGAALLRLKRMYRAAGLPLEGTELPDYLPVMLEFAAAAEGGRGELALREHRPALELLAAALGERGTPYADVVQAVGLVLGEPSMAERARAVRLAGAGPPSELVGLEPFVPLQTMPAPGAGP